jgi:hypothetical protein
LPIALARSFRED